jgi:hypothetical protein
VGIGDGGVVIRAKLKTKLSPEGRTGQRLVRSACDRAARRGARLAASIRKIVDHRRVDNQGVPGIVAFDVKIRQLLDAHEVDAVERLAVRLVEGERAGTVSIIRIGGLACHHIGEVDIGKVDQVRIRNRPIPSKTDDLSCEILGAIEHELAGIAVAVRKSHRRRACARNVQRLAAVDRHWPGGWGIIDQRPAGRILASSKAGSELPETFRLTESVPLASSHDATVIGGVHMTRYVLQILKIDMILHVFVRIFRETDDCSPEVVRIIENERGRDSYRPPGVPKVTVWPEETEPPISTVAWLKSSIDLVPVMFPAIVTTAAELLAELPASISPLFRTLSSICSVWPAGTSRMPPALFVTRRLPTGPLAVLV